MAFLKITITQPIGLKTMERNAANMSRLDSAASTPRQKISRRTGCAFLNSWLSASSTMRFASIFMPSS